MRSFKTFASAIALGAVLAAPASAKELESIGISVGLLGNPFFVATINGIEDAAKKINPDVKVTSVSADYDLNKQSGQIDSFIAAGVDIIMLNAVDAEAIAPAVKRARDAGVIVAAFDVSAPGADVTVMTDNLKAGDKACEYIAEKLGGKGNVLIVNGPQSSSIRDRAQGCRDAFARHPELVLLSDDQNGQGSREGGLAVGQALLARFDHIDGVFAINDPTGIGFALAAKQANRNEFIITGVDGAPDTEVALQDADNLFKASASQDPYTMAGQSLDLAYQVLQGNPPAEPVVLLEPALITNENIADYKGWTAPR
ncbi:ABC transporter substrate-binding protein [Xinfangfangia sp. D13-10-4-6]|uniref:ABC transporter substrate-binding protein n=1 Tax=Pseudogemmobacter hezensis TaxID=2737662 RepID=UPI001553F444|nr:ABC transporter substrate-binding protein [Pseudogemmobacter hezensis]NPD14730.1 ABC transporter substrate-binding protein [Pseudogemmobacter hezensis]